MKLNVLSIDDSRAVLKYIEWSFSQMEHNVTTVLEGKVGVEMVREQPGKYDLLLLDWEMPEIDGIEVLRQIRSFDKNIKIVMVTSRNNEKDIREALNLGADEFIMKPFTPELLSEKLEEVVG